MLLSADESDAPRVKGARRNPGRPSLAIVAAFFGQPPLWLPASFVSCRENRDVRWFIYTDFTVADPPPANVTLRQMTVRELGLKASEVTGTRIEIADLRKINDLKPLYGLIFADDLESFDFWAYSDLDIVWGDVRSFVTDSILADHDIVSSRRNRLSGHFTLFRNTARINRTFEFIPDVAKAMATPQHLILDERGFTRHLRERLGAGSTDSMPRVEWSRELTMSAAYQRALGVSAADSLWWRNGKTFDAHGKELMYLHFHKLKKKMKTINFGSGDTPAVFRINRGGFWA